MAEIIHHLSPHHIDLKGRIVSGFFENPFLEIDRQALGMRFGCDASTLDDVLKDLMASGILSEDHRGVVFDPQADLYADLDAWCRALQGNSADIRQKVVERETLGRLQEQLAVSQEEVGAILEIVPAGVFFLDKFGHLLKCNTLGSRLVGGAHRDPHFDLCERLGLDLDTIISSPVDCERDGTPPLAITTRPFVSAARDGGVVVSVQDISARRKLETEAERLRQDFFSMIRHELRKPLMTIERGLAELGNGEAASLARTAAAHMGEMVDDMLLLARLERDPMAVSTGQEISLQFLLAGSDLAFRAKAETAGVTLTMVMPDEDTTFVGDERRLSQVLGNLLDNAIKFTPGGGQVTLSGYSDEQRVCVEVVDTGVGIPMAERENVLDKFYQVETQNREQGLGLGLAICNKIVAAHDGVLEIEDGVAGGTRIVVQLPLEAR